MDCGKKRERGGILGGDNASGQLEGIGRGPRRKGSRGEEIGFSEKERKAQSDGRKKKMSRCGLESFERSRTRFPGVKEL